MPETFHHFPDLTGNVLWVEVAGANESSRDGILIELPHFTTIGDRAFATGRVAQNRRRLGGVEVGVAWDAVIHYMIFDSSDDYEKRTATSLGYRSEPARP